MALPRDSKRVSLQEKTLLNCHEQHEESSNSPVSFAIYAEDCLNILGPEPELKLEISYDNYPFAHEACVYIPSQDAVFVTSNQWYPTGPIDVPGHGKTITLSKLTRSNSSGSWTREELSTDIVMGNGGVNYQHGIVFCSQGDMISPGGLVYMEVTPPYKSIPMLEHYHGRPFNSVNDVVEHSDGSIWFTDPCYGFKQGIRPAPQLPNQVYRFDPVTGDVKAVAWGFKRPNGLCFSPDEKIMYVTDTGKIIGDGTFEETGPSLIFAFDVMSSGGPHTAPTFLANRRLFAMADVGVPDGIKCDIAGNVYSGCGDGVNIWNPAGNLLGKILVKGGVANFCFGKPGELFLLNESKFWVAKISKTVKGALLAKKIDSSD